MLLESSIRPSDDNFQRMGGQNRPFFIRFSCTLACFYGFRVAEGLIPLEFHSYCSFTMSDVGGGAPPVAPADSGFEVPTAGEFSGKPWRAVVRAKPRISS